MRLDAEDDAEDEEEDTGLETAKNAPPVQPPPGVAGVADDWEGVGVYQASGAGAHYTDAEVQPGVHVLQ